MWYNNETNEISEVKRKNAFDSPSLIRVLLESSKRKKLIIYSLILLFTFRVELFTSLVH